MIQDTTYKTSILMREVKRNTLNVIFNEWTITIDQIDKTKILSVVSKYADLIKKLIDSQMNRSNYFCVILHKMQNLQNRDDIFKIK